jgi:hypothetical protein
VVTRVFNFEPFFANPHLSCDVAIVVSFFMLQELELIRHSVFLKDKELELLQKKADGAIELKEQVYITVSETTREMRIDDNINNLLQLFYVS